MGDRRSSITIPWTHTTEESSKTFTEEQKQLLVQNAKKYSSYRSADPTGSTCCEFLSGCPPFFASGCGCLVLSRWTWGLICTASSSGRETGSKPLHLTQYLHSDFLWLSRPRPRIPFLLGRVPPTTRMATAPPSCPPLAEDDPEKGGRAGDIHFGPFPG